MVAASAPAASLARAAAVCARAVGLAFSPVSAQNFYRRRFLNLAIATLITLEASVVMHWDLQFNTHSTSTFYHMLFPEGFHNDHDYRGTSVFHLYDIDTALQVLKTAVLRFYSWPKRSVDFYQIAGPAKIHLALLDSPPRLTDAGALHWRPALLPAQSYVVTEQEPLGPFANRSQDMFHRLVKMDLELHLISIAREAEGFKPFEWEVHLVWDSAHRGGRVDMSLAAAALPLHAGHDGEHRSPTHGGVLGAWAWLTLGVLCGSSLAAQLRAAARTHPGRGRPLLRPAWLAITGGAVARPPAGDHRGADAGPGEGGEVLTGGDGGGAGGCAVGERASGEARGPFYWRWPFHCGIRDVATLAFLILDASQGRHTLERRGRWGAKAAGGGGGRHGVRRPAAFEQEAPLFFFEDLLVWLELWQGIHVARLAGAIGVFWAWLCVCEAPSTSLLSQVLAKAIPQVASFLFAALPLYLGFASLGMVLFAEHASAKFGTLGSSCVTLFSLLNGDVLMETMLEVEPAGALLSRGYVCAFISVFVFTVLNAVLCLIQDAFRLVKAKHIAGGG